MGESGSGKSVTNLAILGLLPKDSARVEATRLEFDGTDLRDLSKEELRSIRGNEIAMVFQDPMTALNPFMRIETQMAEVLEAHTNLDKRAIRNRCGTLGRVGIPEPENRIRSYPHEFSGGMRQRVLIAMALLAEPRLLIADEPTTALDVTIQKQILDSLRELVRERGLSMILVTHDLGVVAEAVDRVVVLYGGQDGGGSYRVAFSKPGSSLHPRFVDLPAPVGKGGCAIGANPRGGGGSLEEVWGALLLGVHRLRNPVCRSVPRWKMGGFQATRMLECGSRRGMGWK